jgi:hypothetical protein
MEHVLGPRRIVKIDNQRGKPLLMDAGRRGFRITTAVHGNAKWRQNSAQDLSRLIVGRNQ